LSGERNAPLQLRRHFRPAGITEADILGYVTEAGVAVGRMESASNPDIAQNKKTIEHLLANADAAMEPIPLVLTGVPCDKGLACMRLRTALSNRLLNEVVADYERQEKKTALPGVEKPRPVDKLEDKLVLLRSPVVKDRINAVNWLAVIYDKRARLALEDRMIRDPSMVVRYAAIDALGNRGEVESLRVMFRVMRLAATSAERARIGAAIKRIQQHLATRR
jgi:hypothetical protein